MDPSCYNTPCDFLILNGSQKCGRLGNRTPLCPISSSSDPLQDSDLLIHHRESTAKINHLVLVQHFG